MFKTLDHDLATSQLQRAAGEGKPLYVNLRAGIGTYTTEDVTQIFRIAQALGIEEVHVMLSSGGGLVIRGIELHNFLRSIPIKINMHNSGTIDSIANTVFLAADAENRSAEPNSRFMFHGVSREFKGGATESILKEALTAVRRDQQAIAETIADRSGMTLKEIKRAFRGESIFDPEEAKRKGLIHEIKQLQMPSDAVIINVFDPLKVQDDS